MDDWQPISTAPQDGTVVVVVKQARDGSFPYPIRATYKPAPDHNPGAGRWLADFGNGRFRPFEPQPTHWRPGPGNQQERP